MIGKAWYYEDTEWTQPKCGGQKNFLEEGMLN